MSKFLSLLTRKAYSAAEIQIRLLLTSAQDRDELSASSPGHFTSGYRMSRSLGGPQSQPGWFGNLLSIYFIMTYLKLNGNTY